MESNIHCLYLELINYFFVHQSDDLAKKIESDPMENKWQSPVKIGNLWPPHCPIQPHLRKVIICQLVYRCFYKLLMSPFFIHFISNKNLLILFPFPWPFWLVLWRCRLRVRPLTWCHNFKRSLIACNHLFMILETNILFYHLLVPFFNLIEHGPELFKYYSFFL